MKLKDKILAAPDLKAESLEIPEWDVTVEVRGMSGKLRAKFVEMAYQNGMGSEQDQAKMGAAMLPLFPEFVLDGVYDPENGEKVFAAGDLEALLQKNGQVLERIALKVIELSGLNEKAVDEAGKN